MNKMIDGKQCTVGWHVDDLMTTHVSDDVITELFDKLNEVFGKETPLSISRGTKHDYLGMELDFSEPGVLRVSMFDYIKGVLAGVPDEMNKGTAVTPAAKHLFDVNDDPTQLDDKRREDYHRITMQLQYLSQRARPDLRPAVSFLCKRTTKPDQDDWKKLCRSIHYLRET